MPPRTRLSTRLAAPWAAGLLLGVLSAAGDPDDAAAERIVATASEAVGLTVVTTTTDAAGRPVVTSTRARSEARAEDLVADALEDGATVSMAQPVNVSASNDTYLERGTGLPGLAWQHEASVHFADLSRSASFPRCGSSPASRRPATASRRGSRRSAGSRSPCACCSRSSDLCSTCRTR